MNKSNGFPKIPCKLGNRPYLLPSTDASLFSFWFIFCGAVYHVLYLNFFNMVSTQVSTSVLKQFPNSGLNPGLFNMGPQLSPQQIAMLSQLQIPQFQLVSTVLSHIFHTHKCNTCPIFGRSQKREKKLNFWLQVRGWDHTPDWSCVPVLRLHGGTPEAVRRVRSRVLAWYGTHLGRGGVPYESRSLVVGKEAEAILTVMASTSTTVNAATALQPTWPSRPNFQAHGEPFSSHIITIPIFPSWFWGMWQSIIYEKIW